MLYVKGAPEIVLGKCKGCHDVGRQTCGCGGIPFYGGGSVARKATRIWLCVHLALHSKIVDDAEASDCVSLVAENDLSFLGVVAISDPIRPDVPAAVPNASRQVSE